MLRSLSLLPLTGAATPPYKLGLPQGERTMDAQAPVSFPDAKTRRESEPA